MARTTLNSGDITTLRAFVLADAATATWRTNGDDGSIAAWLNLDEGTPTKAWSNAADPRTIDEATPWINADAIPANKVNSFNSYLHAFFKYPRDFSTNAVRKWITDIWGNSTDAQAILTAALLNASRAQVAIGGTVRTTATISGLDRTYIGQVTSNEVAAMRGGGW